MRGFRVPRRAGHEVYHGVCALDGAPEAVGVRQIPLDDLASPGAQLLLLLRLARQHPHGLLRRAEGVDDVRTDEAGSPGGQDHSAVKFFQ